MEASKKPPQYLKVKRHILEQLRIGALTPHDKLPTERELTDKFHVNRNTVRHALTILEREGRIYRSGRKGWFTSGQRLVFDPSKEHVNFDKRARQQKFEPSWEVIESGTTTASGELQELFDVEEGTPLYHIYETGSLDGQPVYYSEYFFLADICPGFLPKIISQPMTDVLRDDYDIHLFQKHLLIRPINMAERMAGLLELPAHYPGVFFRRVKTSQTGQVVEVDFEYWRADSIELRSSYETPQKDED
ncbi:UTRA domain-containing protein [Pseudodesulfovibrio sp. zrk46]|uniref:UTRA domain-containing protein n=1 Tax=Pseudodesulfovibrio sp. zrk46 TaxID=2725288 RepID=UPI001449C60A|nr:UTRA domain-containing protein [Pseudodesulfovibrio sp. zrk46]QJB56511.1 UTRA domain-containing protein [Pseudodesulfovibrio sp. zrk46]